VKHAASIIIVGAGPAGLTAALELQNAGINDITVIEAGSQVGGISRTVQHNGNRIDIGGHRFFSKSDWVMRWWQQLLPITDNSSDKNTDTPNNDQVMLRRNRLSRIYFNRQFFDYPLKLNVETLIKLGPWKTINFGLSYVAAKIKPVHPESSLEDFLINRFGRRLYLQFFKEYTEKVWGVPCNQISAAWGAQRIKSLSILKAIAHALGKLLGQSKSTEQTSLIESFLYPKYGPGQMWETAAQRFVENGGKLLLQSNVERIDIDNNQVCAAAYCDSGGKTYTLSCTHLISTMPISELVHASAPVWPEEIRHIAANLSYRDFITVGLLYPREAITRQLNDNWIYIQEPGVNVGRVQVFNNWSPYMVADASTVWLGLEFFCREGDKLWAMEDNEFKLMAHQEMVKIGLVKAEAANDAVVLRVPKAYPGYFGQAYTQFNVLQTALDSISNLFLIGRNGMHRYNNQDHSMLTAKEAARQIVENEADKTKIWSINVDDEYHEEK